MPPQCAAGTATASVESFQLKHLIRQFVHRLMRKPARRPNRASPSGTRFEHKLLVGTHHKCATVWMASIFKSLCRDLGMTFYSGQLETLPQTFDVWHEDHSRFGDGIDFAYCRGLHIVRDPRDVIVSACRYHQTSDESQLHIPLEKFGGLTYQEKLNSLETFDRQLLFEMEHSAGSTVRDIIKWDYQQPAFFEAKYEDLMRDEDLFLFHRIFTFLGLPANLLPFALETAYNNSLFSGKVTTKHVRSGRLNQWRDYFQPVHKEKFIDLFGDALIKLGYESDHDWTTGTGQ